MHVFSKNHASRWGPLFGSQRDVASRWCFACRDFCVVSILPAEYVRLIIFYIVILVVIRLDVVPEPIL